MGEWLFVPEGAVIVAWHEVPGTSPLPRSRPVGHGLILQVCALRFGD